MRVNVDLIFLRIFSMNRPEALVVCRISKACCTVSHPFCRGRRQIFIGLPSVFNERFLDLHTFDSRPIIEDTAFCAMQGVLRWRISVDFAGVSFSCGTDSSNAGSLNI